MSQTIERGYRKSQSLWNRAMSFDKLEHACNNTNFKSQSLWNRACLSTEMIQSNIARDPSQSLWNRACLSTFIKALTIVTLCLNPFGTGHVFRLQWGVRALCGKASQSHFPTFSDV